MDNIYRLKSITEGEDIYIGIDNGVSGTIGIVSGTFYDTFKTKTYSQQSYTMKKKKISRLDFVALDSFLQELCKISPVVALLENPATTNSFNVVSSSMRCFEATLIALEINGIEYTTCTAGSWQKIFIPEAIAKNKELKGDKHRKERTENLKTASMVEGIKLCPTKKEFITKHGDADGLLIAEHLRRLKTK